MGVVILVQCAVKDAPLRCVALPLYGLQKEASHPLCESREAAQAPPHHHLPRIRLPAAAVSSGQGPGSL